MLVKLDLHYYKPFAQYMFDCFHNHTVLTKVVLFDGLVAVPVKNAVTSKGAPSAVVRHNNWISAIMYLQVRV